MAMSNIDNFNKITSALFAKLYKEFPVKCKHLAYNDFCSEFDFDECQEIFTASIEFLEHEGFIRYSANSGSGHFGNVVLTLKGLSALQKIPSTIDKTKESIGESLVKRVEENSWQIATNLATQALQGVE